MFSASSRYELTTSISMRSRAPSRRSSITGSRQCHGIVEEQRALVADDLELVPSVEREPGVEMRKHVVGEPHRRREHDVDAVATGHLLGADPVGLPGDQPRSVHAVGPDVHQRAAVQRLRQPDVGGVGPRRS